MHFLSRKWLSKSSANWRPFCTGIRNPCQGYRNPRVVIMPTFSSQAVPRFVMTTNPIATGADKVDIMTAPGFQCQSYESNSRCATLGNLCAITDGYILPGRLAKSAAWHLAQCEMGAWLGTPGGLTRLTSWLAAIRLDDTGPQCLLDGAWGPWVGGKLHSANASYLDNQHWGRRRSLKRVLRHHWRHWIERRPHI